MLEKDPCRRVARVDWASEDLSMWKLRASRLLVGYEAELLAVKATYPRGQHGSQRELRP